MTAQGVSLKPFKELLEQQASDVIKRGILVAVNEFLNDVLRKKLSIEDEETGELVVIEGANNPLANFSVDIERKSSGLDESNKPALAYQYVDSLRRWIIPEVLQASLIYSICMLLRLTGLRLMRSLLMIKTQIALSKKSSVRPRSGFQFTGFILML